VLSDDEAAALRRMQPTPPTPPATHHPYAKHEQCLSWEFREDLLHRSVVPAPPPPHANGCISQACAQNRKDARSGCCCGGPCRDAPGLGTWTRPVTSRSRERVDPLLPVTPPTRRWTMRAVYGCHASVKGLPVASVVAQQHMRRDVSRWPVTWARAGVVRSGWRPGRHGSLQLRGRRGPRACRVYTRWIHGRWMDLGGTS